MIEKYFLPILGIISIGWVLMNLLSVKKKMHLIDQIIGAIVLGYSSLVIPIVIIGVFLNNKIQYFVFFYYGISLLMFMLIVLKLIKNLDKIDLNFSSFNQIEKILIFLTIGVVLIYLLFLIIYDERGWDALQFYFPNALYFYIQNDIPVGYNPFNYYPTFKSPVNTLLIMYSLYVNKGIQHSTYTNLHTWIFLIGTLLSTIKITFIITKSKEISLFSGLLFLVTPLTYFLMYEYAYYQEPPLMFFTSAALYFIVKATTINEIKHKQFLSSEKVIFICLSSISVAMSILSKISGFTIILLIILILPSSSSMSKYFKVLIITLLTFFMSYKAVYNEYIGYVPVIIFVGIIIITKIFSNNGKKIDMKYVLLLLTAPIIIGTIWLMFIIQNPNVSEVLFNRYFSFDTMKQLRYSFLGNTSGNVSLEHGMSVSFAASVLYIFTGSMFSLSLIIPKVLGLFMDNNEYNNNTNKQLQIFTLSFLLIWLGYHATVSVRYLVPILVPINILTSISVYKIFSYFKLNEDRIILKLSIIFFVALFYYPFIPINLIFIESINQRIYLYHLNQLTLLVYGVIISLIFLFFIRYKINFTRKNYNRILYTFVIGLLLIFSEPQHIMLIQNNYDIDEFNHKFNYFQHEQYHLLIDEIITISPAIEDVFLTVNIPGLSYYISRSVIDLMVIRNAVGTDVNFTSNLNVDEIFNKYNIYYIITLNRGHPYFDNYEKTYSNLNIFKVVGDNSKFSLIYYNEEYSLYFRIY